MAQAQLTDVRGFHLTDGLEPSHVAGDGQVIGPDLRACQSVTRDELQHAVALYRVKTMCQHQGLQCRPPGFRTLQGIAPHHARYS